VTEITATPDVERGEVTFTREFEAPRELVFRALMEPEQLVHFWGPPGTHVPLDPLAYRSPEALAGFATTLDLLADHLTTLVRPDQNVPPTS
jgi:uncharacterized protein YndB with AHSA1/START domain